jgi:putative nucleotidyltransferase with HDIG domain
VKEKRDLQRLVFDIASLVDLGQEVTSSKDFHEKMKMALYVITGMFSVPKAALFLHHAKRRCFTLLASKGIGKPPVLRLSLPAAQIKTLLSSEPHDVDALKKMPLYEGNRAIFERLHTRTLVPLFVKNELVGALSLGNRLSRSSYLPSERDVLKVVAHQLATTLHNSSLFLELTSKVHENKKLYENMRRIYRETIQAFAAAIDAKDAYTKNHSFRVANYAVAIARELGWKGKDREAIYVAGLLHDIGKITIDRNVLNKENKLTAREQREIKKHSQVSYDILTKIKFPWKNVANFVKHHHERVDGNGYPDSLAGAELSDGVKILALADAFDAMTTDRPYREKLSPREAFHEVKKCIGTQFDSRISTVFFKVLDKELNRNRKQRGSLSPDPANGAFKLGKTHLHPEEAHTLWHDR